MRKDEEERILEEYIDMSNLAIPMIVVWLIFCGVCAIIWWKVRHACSHVYRNAGQRTVEYKHGEVTVYDRKCVKCGKVISLEY